LLMWSRCGARLVVSFRLVQSRDQGGRPSGREAHRVEGAAPATPLTNPQRIPPRIRPGRHQGGSNT